MHSRVTFTSLASLMLVLSSASAQPGPPKTPASAERKAYFGETHVHTSWSFDAYIFGNMKAGPEDAYKYALGQPIDHPAGYKVKITRPLDFMAVTDHAEYAGTRSARKRPELADQQIAHRRKAEGPKQGGHPARVPVSGDFPSRERAD